MRFKTKDGLKGQIKVFKDWIWDPALKKYTELKKVFANQSSFYRVEMTTGEKYILPSLLSLKTEAGKQPISMIKKGTRVYREDGTLVMVNLIKKECGVSERVTIPDMPNFVCENLWCIGRSYR